MFCDIFLAVHGDQTLFTSDLRKYCMTATHTDTDMNTVLENTV